MSLTLFLVSSQSNAYMEGCVRTSQDQKKIAFQHGFKIFTKLAANNPSKAMLRLAEDNELARSHLNGTPGLHRRSQETARQETSMIKLLKAC